MEPLSAKVLNTQIISMRKEVRRAVVHQIHDLTRKADRLRIKSGSDEQKKKNAMKADNFVSEIQILKKVKADEVSLFALSNPAESDLKALIAKPIMSPEGRAMAKLCLRPNMRNAVNEFLSRYSDSLELLNNLISDRYNKKEKACKKKKKKVKKKSAKDCKQKLRINNTKEDHAENLSEASDSIPLLVPIPGSSQTKENLAGILGNSNETESEIENQSSDDGIAGSFSDAGDKSSEEESESENGYHNDSLQESPEKKNSIKKSLIVDKNIKSINEGVWRQNELQAENKSRDNSSILNRDSKLSKIERKRVDPFFKTSDDSEYLTYCDVEKKEANKKDIVPDNSNCHDLKSEQESVTSFKKGFRNENSFKKDFHSKNSFPRNSDNKNSIRKQFYEKAPGKRSFNDFRSFNRSFNRGGQRSSNVVNVNRPYNSRAADGKSRNGMSKIQPGIQTQEIKLHPSWEAKKKINQAPVAFQGKKIVFDD